MSRGGGGPEITEGYSLYIEGDIVDIEGYELKEGNRTENNIKIRWIINKIEANETLFQKKYNKEMIIQFIREAFEAYGRRGLKEEQILDVVVEINGDIKIR